MMYRVIRDLGPSDYVVGAVFDGAAISPVRLRQLVDQNRIEPVLEPGSEHAALLGMAQQLAALEAKVAAMETRNATQEAGEPAGDTPPITPEPVVPPTPPTPPADDAPEDLSKLTVEKLKERAVARGIKGAASMTKADLVAALTAQEGAPDA